MIMGSRVIHNEPSDLHISTLESSETKSSLKQIFSHFISCFGPNGKIKCIHNNSGGHITLTSSSSRLTGLLNVKNPLSKIIITSMQAHISKYHDGGLFAASFCLLLIENALKLDIHRKLLTEIFELLLGKCLDGLSGSSFPAKDNIDFSNKAMPLDFIKSILQPKQSACTLTDKQCNFMCDLVFRVFLKSYTGFERRNTLSTINYLVLEGKPATDSFICDGLLFQAPQIPLYTQENISVHRQETGLHESKIKIALICVSMSGDSEEFIDADYEITESNQLNDTVLHNLVCFKDHLIGLKVAVVACQKVIHPKIKLDLKQAGLFVIDRLGLNYIQGLQQLTGGSLIGSYDTDLTDSSCGWLTNLEHKVLNGKSYLHFQSTTGITTMVLFNTIEETVEELKSTVQSCMNGLEQSLYDNRLLCGAGCWISVLIHQIMDITNVEEWTRSLGCSKLQYTDALHAFTLSLRTIMMTLGHKGCDYFHDLTYHHFWSLPFEDQHRDNSTCMCGAIQRHDRLEYVEYIERFKHIHSSIAEVDLSRCHVWDSFPVIVNALKTAVLTANAVLKIHHFVESKN